MKTKILKNSVNFNPCTQNMEDANEEIVISGLAGRFPESDDLKHFKENLLNKKDLITEDDRRWNLGKLILNYIIIYSSKKNNISLNDLSDHPELPSRFGKINNLEKFDADFFGIHFKEAHSMDPMGRMLLEHSYEAIIDAGVNPKHLKGTNTGVFFSACYSESEVAWVYENQNVKIISSQ